MAMTRVRTRKFVAAAVLAGFIVSAIATFLILRAARTAHAASAVRRVEPPFKFSRSVVGGLTEFTSNIAVIALRSEWSGPVSRSKSYSAFTMEIYEPSTKGPARLTNAPALITRVGVRLHGMVSRQFPKLS